MVASRLEPEWLLIMVVVTVSLLLHSITYHRTVASQTPSNVWYTIYGVLNGGTWVDGLKHSQELLHNRPSLAPSDWQATIFKLSVAALQSDGVQGLHLLRAECLSELRRHPGKLVSGWWRAVRFLWSKNTLFRATYAENPSVWFTESARWCTVLGVALSLFFLLKGKNLALKFKPYQGLSWLNLAALLGIVASLPLHRLGMQGRGSLPPRSLYFSFACLGVRRSFAAYCQQIS